MSCFKQKLPSIRYKLLSSLLQPLTTAGFSFPGDKGCVCTATRAVYQMLTANCLPSTAITAGPNSSFFKKKNQRKKKKRVSAQGGFVFLDSCSFMKIAVQRSKLTKLWTPKLSIKFQAFKDALEYQGNFPKNQFLLCEFSCLYWPPNTL